MSLCGGDRHLCLRKAASPDLNGNVETVTNARGFLTRVGYDAEDRKLLTTEAEGTAEQRISGVVEYDKVGNPVQVRDGNGHLRVTVYNALNLPWKQYDPAPFAANFVETRYDKNGKPVSVTNRRGFTTTTHYDALGRVDLVTDPVPFESQTIVTTYDKVGNVRTVKDKRNIVSENLYDDLYRPIEQRRDNVRLVTNEYDDAGNKTATVDAENHRVESAYNSRNLLEKTTFIDGVDNFYAEQFYDGVGNVISAFNEARQETVTTYDAENRKRTVTFAGEMSENLYDAVGNLTTAYKPKRNSRSMSYDGLNRLETVGEGSLTTAYTYDANGNLRSEEDPRGHLVEFTYDALNRKTAHIQHKASGNLTVSYDLYDAEGNLKQTTDAKGQVFSFEYDALNRQTLATYPDVATPYLTPLSVATTYDANNNVATVTETKTQSGGGTVTDVTSNVYDHFDRLDSSTQRNVLLDYSYDANGNRTSVVTANGSTVYTFDARNRLETAVVGAETTTYSYTPIGQTESVSYPNGTTATYSYWPSNRVETITHQAGETVISRFAYTYDANGNRTQQVEVQGTGSETVPVPLVTDYGYDDLDRLENFTVTTDGNATATAYTFDGYNRKTENVSVNAVPTVAKTYDYDESNWLTSVTDNVDPANLRTIGYQYDANGNTLEKSSNCGPTTTFVFDSRNQLVETTQGATLLGRYDYDAQGLRVRHRNSERGDVDYYYDDGAVLEERLASGDLLAHYRYADRLLSLNTGSETQYYHHDALGSTVDLTDQTGAVQTRYTLDPWGHIRNQVGSSVNRMVFTGQEHDEQTGLIYFGARYYDPDSARFLTQDSYLGEPGTPPSLHRYLYAYSNPTVYVDLMGYASTEKDWEGIKTIPRAEPWSYDNNVPLNIAKAVGNGINNVGNSLLVDLPNDFLRIGQYLNNHGLSKTGKDAVDDTAVSVKNTYHGVKNYLSGAIDYAKNVPATKQVEDTVSCLTRAETLERGVTIGLSVYVAGKAPAITDNAATLTEEALNGAKSVGKKIDTAYRNSRLADETGAIGDGVGDLKAKRNVPNPEGKKGSLRHQGYVEDELRSMEKRYNDDPDIEIRTEVPVRGNDGQLRYVDAQARNKTTKEIVDQVQVGRSNKNGMPVARERRNMEDIDRSTGFDTRYRAYDK